MDEASFRERLGEAIRRPDGRGETVIGLPAVLGLRESGRRAEDLEEITGARVFEIPMLPPSIPGTADLPPLPGGPDREGGDLSDGESGHPAPIVKDGRCEGITVQNPPLATEYRAESYILATGRFLGGGLWADMDRIAEPLFHLPVFQPASARRLVPGAVLRVRRRIRSTARGSSRTQDLRPVDETGRVVLENVRVAGSILAHHQAIEEHSREGIDIATGYLAAKRALAS